MAAGKKTGGGSRKGIPNKVGADLRGMVEGALSAVGGMTYLQEQATANPTAFLTLVGKCLPKVVEGNPDKPLTGRIILDFGGG